MTLTEIVQKIEHMQPFEAVTLKCPEDHEEVTVWYTEGHAEECMLWRRWFVGGPDTPVQKHFTIMDTATAVVKELEHIL